MKFSKKPVVIEAVQLNWKNWNAVCELLGDIISPANPGRSVETYSDTCGEQGPPWIELTVPTLGDDMVARHGDWLIRGVNGGTYPCKPDIFAKTYDPCEGGGQVTKPKAERVCGNCDHFAQSESAKRRRSTQGGCQIGPMEVYPGRLKTSACDLEPPAFTPVGGRKAKRRAGA